jgi:hypothetical protein
VEDLVREPAVGTTDSDNRLAHKKVAMIIEIEAVSLAKSLSIDKRGRSLPLSWKSY